MIAATKRREFITLLGGAAQDSRILPPVSSLLVAFSAILLTSVVLLAVDSFLDAKALVFIYLLPTIVMAMPLWQHCCRPDLVRQRLGSGVLLLSSEVQLLYF